MRPRKRLPKENWNHKRCRILETFSGPYCAAILPQDSPPGIFKHPKQKAKSGGYSGKSWRRVGTNCTTFAGAGFGTMFWKALIAEMSRMWRGTETVGNLAREAGATCKCEGWNLLTPGFVRFNLIRWKRKWKKYAYKESFSISKCLHYQKRCKTYIFYFWA